MSGLLPLITFTLWITTLGSPTTQKTVYVGTPTGQCGITRGPGSGPMGLEVPQVINPTYARFNDPNSPWQLCRVDLTKATATLKDGEYLLQVTMHDGRNFRVITPGGAPDQSVPNTPHIRAFRIARTVTAPVLLAQPVQPVQPSPSQPGN
jgi:hypothetical protein